jgi:hypothetical protein
MVWSARSVLGISRPAGYRQRVRDGEEAGDQLVAWSYCLLAQLLHLDNAPRETRRVLRPWMRQDHFWSCWFIHAHCMSNITIVLLLQGRREPGYDREGSAVRLVLRVEDASFTGANRSGTQDRTGVPGSSN